MRKVCLVAFVMSMCALVVIGCKNNSSGAPSIALYDVTGGGKTAVNPGGTVDFGIATMYPAVDQTRTFSIENNGTADLTLTGTSAKVVISGTDAANFSIPTQPPASIPAGGSTDFDIVFTATSGSYVTRNASVGIESDDPDLADVSFNVTGSDNAC